VSNKALDVLNALLLRLRESGSELALGEALTAIERANDRFRLTTTQRQLACDKLILTVGGQSYPGCGTAGDGYVWAAHFGHAIVPPRPALVPITTKANWVHSLSGLTIPDVRVSIVISSRASTDISISPAAVRVARQLKKKHLPLAEDRGSFLFTHVGLSGPVVLNVSRAISGHLAPSAFDLVCDFLPDIKLETLEADLRAAAASDGKRSIANLAARFVPRRLADALLAELKLQGDLRSAELSKVDRRRLVEAIKQMPIPISGTLGFKKAEVTAGGVALDEVDSRTLQSKLVPGLYFAGEILDLDGPIGGYNFQAAFATGMLAGENV
jgi:predicted flavoprotein YhiN